MLDLLGFDRLTGRTRLDLEFKAYLAEDLDQIDLFLTFCAKNVKISL